MLSTSVDNRASEAIRNAARAVGRILSSCNCGGQRKHNRERIVARQDSSEHLTLRASNYSKYFPMLQCDRTANEKLVAVGGEAIERDQFRIRPTATRQPVIRRCGSFR